MLNELHRLSVTLANNNIDLQEYKWHYEYEELPSNNCFRIWLAADGTVAHIELMDKTLVAACRKYGNNRQTFPAFNIAALYRVTSDEDKKYFDLLINGKAAYDSTKLKALCICNNWSAKLRQKIDGCLHKTIPGMPTNSAISELMRITCRLDNAAFRDSIENCIWNRLRDDISAYLPLLIHKGNENKKTEEADGSLSIILDLSNWEKYGNPIASEAVTRQINKWLIAYDTETTPLFSDELDAFGDPYSNVNKKMPLVKLTPMFTVRLRTMFDEQKCQCRYQKAEDASFPIIMKRRYVLQASLGWISQAENEGVMWRKIDNGAIIFVYPDKLPKVLPKFAALLGGNETETRNAVTESRFKDAAKSFIETLDAIEYKERPENILIFALQQIPPVLSKHAKVVFTRNLTVYGLIDAAKTWQRGCENLPDKLGLDIDIDIKIPFPLNMPKVVNKVWKRDGTRADGKSSAKLMRYYQGMELLIDKPQPSQIMRIVHGVTSNALGLVMFAANQLPRTKGKIKPAQKEEIEYLLPLLGLLLFKSGIAKEVYMRETAYLVGQLLKISDGLHALYCEIKRGGDIPPQLAGNSVFATASETPVQALALLCVRMNPYIAWAKQYRWQKEEKSGLANWYLRQCETLAPKLKEKLTSNIRFGDLEKAQLFIGYLAKLPESDKSNKEESSKQEGAEDGQ
ncbi:MAG: hypothetical protein LBU13_03435 [Synergistaceae bacterium]|jgi:hypothetical protein|nr:hypothetical protein [Synergistaceae bacterium]